VGGSGEREEREKTKKTYPRRKRTLFPFFANLFSLKTRKKRGELALQRSSVLDWTIIRPGGLKDGDSSSSSSEGGVVAVGPDGIGFPSLFSSSTSSSSRPPRQRPGSISRKAVADLAVDALVVPAAVGKVVEVVSRKDAPRRGAEELFSNAEQN